MSGQILVGAMFQDTVLHVNQVKMVLIKIYFKITVKVLDPGLIWISALSTLLLSFTKLLCFSINIIIIIIMLYATVLLFL